MSGDTGISVIIPAYNASETLVEALDSVAGQSYNNYELIVVDDGSTDNTPLCCFSHELFKTGKLKYVYTENGGVSKARNIGISIASGDLITFLDADDTLPVNAFKAAFRDYTDRDYDYAHYSSKICGKETSTESVSKDSYLIQEPKEKGEFIKALLGFSVSNKHIEKTRTLGCVWSSFFRRKLLKDYTIQFDESLSIMEDLVFTMSVVNRSNRILISDHCSYLYRANDGSAMRSWSNRREQDILSVVSKLAEADGSIEEVQLVPIAVQSMSSALSQRLKYGPHENTDLSRLVRNELFTNNRRIVIKNLYKVICRIPIITSIKCIVILLNSVFVYKFIFTR